MMEHHSLKSCILNAQHQMFCIFSQCILVCSFSKKLFVSSFIKWLDQISVSLTEIIPCKHWGKKYSTLQEEPAKRSIASATFPSGFHRGLLTSSIICAHLLINYYLIHTYRHHCDMLIIPHAIENSLHVN